MIVPPPLNDKPVGIKRRWPVSGGRVLTPPAALQAVAL